MDLEDKKILLELLKNIQILIQKDSVKHDGDNEQQKNSVEYDDRHIINAQQKDSDIPVVSNAIFKDTNIKKTQEKPEKPEKIKINIEKNQNNIEKINVRKEKCEKDIYNCINGENKRVGEFYGTKPHIVARKIANRIYKQCGKKMFDMKIYNRMTDRLYGYRAQIVPCEKIKKIGKKKILITHDIKLTRI